MNKVTFPLTQRMQGPQVGDLQDALQLLLDRRLLFADDEASRRELTDALRRERGEQTYGGATRRLVGQFQQERRLQASGEVDEPTATALNRLLAQLGVLEDPEPREAPSDYQVVGRVGSKTSAAVGGLRVRIVDRAVGSDAQLAEVTTDARGAYRAGFTDADVKRRGKTRPDLQARVLAGERILGASEVRYDAGKSETLHVLLDEQAAVDLASEYETLVAALAPHSEGRLGDLRETRERQDVTYVANKAGWDARLVAFAVLSDRLSRTGGSGANEPPPQIHAAFYYALFRAGVATDEETLWRTGVDAVLRVWSEAIQQNVIPRSLAADVRAAASAFQRETAARALERPVPGGPSTLKALLAVSLGDDPTRQRRFAELAAAVGSNPEQLWNHVRDEFGESVERRLKLDGELSVIADGSADLVRKLHAADAAALTATADLARRGYFRAERWLPLVDGDAPAGAPGNTPDEKRASYAAALAAQVRLRYPTLAVAEMVKSGDTSLGVQPAVRDQVHAFLSAHEDRFDVTAQPIARYVKQNGLEAAVPPEVVRQVQRVQRVYQITPSDEAMNGLLRRGIDSAHAVVRRRESDFVREFAADVGGEEQARLTHAKARQVQHAVLTLAAAYVSARRAVPIGVHSPPQIVVPTPEPPGASDITAYPKLEELVGSMDYCACKHCRSVLSPAAYLVDLFYFLENSASGPIQPLEVLFRRRPDLQHLPLTCENTNTALPYVDVVTEILEYFVAHGLRLSEVDANGATVSYQGHTTGDDVTSAELLASPQFVMEAAYEALAQASFPAPLPFNRPLEALRRHFAKLEVPLEEAMERLRADDQLGPGPGKSYGWYDILLERLHLSREERRVLVDGTLTLPELFGFAPGTTDETVLAGLSNVKSFCRRVGIGYDDLFDILSTQFVNPGATLIPRLQRMGVSFENLRRFEAGALSDAEFDALVSPGADPAEFGGDIKAWVREAANFTRIMALIAIRNPAHPEDACAVEELELRYTDPDDTTNRLAALDFIRIARFVRLWKKLGWTIQQVDQALAALRPAGPPAETVAALDAELVTVLPLLGQIRHLLARLRLDASRDLSRLLACWSPVGTFGTSALYRQMFLRHTGLRADAAFVDDGYGNFLSDVTETLAGHSETLRGAFNLTGDEYAQILGHLGFGDGTELNLANVSLVYRWGWLARTLRLSVRELQLLSVSTGLDPFAPLDPPDPPMMRFLRLVDTLRAVSIKPAQALYLIWNQDVSGRSAPSERSITELARVLRRGFAAVDREFALADDPSGELARARLALVYGEQATDFFFGLLNETLIAKVDYIHDQPSLQAGVIAAGQDRIAYDGIRQELSFSGEMTAAVRDALLALMGVPPAFAAAVDGLYTQSYAAIERFRREYPELMAEYALYVASTDPVETRRSSLLARLLPGLRTRRKRQQALAAASAAGGIDAVLAQALLGDPKVLHAAGAAAADKIRPALDDFTALENGSLSARFFWRNTVTDAVDAIRDDAWLDYSPTGDRLPSNPTPNAPISGIWSGHLEVPDSGDYRLVIDTDAGATVALSLAGRSVPLQQAGTQWTTQEPVPLAGATLVPIVLTVERVTRVVQVRWQNSGAPLRVPARELSYAATLLEKSGGAYTRTLKLAALGAALALTPAELAYLAALPSLRIDGDGWVNALPVLGIASASTAASLTGVLTALTAFAQAKREWAPDDERLLAILQRLASGDAEAEAALLELTRWQESSLDPLLARLGLASSDLADVEELWRVREAHRLVDTAGMSGAALVAAVTNAPDGDTVRDLLSALRARYDAAAWNEVLRPINDELRARQRDALVAYVLEKFGESATARHIDTPEKLFEYFLMDVQMEPVMQTSRVRHALSSVQLFIERCLLNLERDVPPERIDADQWAWMKRYRVWEANRKVFLWPENWLEPELRDDQSPPFKETLAELLEKDVTEEAADAALLNYLSKLEEVAKLEPSGMYTVPGSAQSPPIVHVVARTAGAHRKYFHRKREGRIWSPWTQIKLDIEDDPVVPVVWKGRLLLFWLRILKQGQLTQAPAAVDNASPPNPKRLTELTTAEVKTSGDQATKTTVQAVLCWSEYYNGKWQGARTSDVNRAATLGTMESHAMLDRSQARIYSKEDGDTLLLFVLASAGLTSFRFYNPRSLPHVEPVTDILVPNRALQDDDGTLQAWYGPPSVQHLTDYSLPGSGVNVVNVVESLRSSGFSVVAPTHAGGDHWTTPFLVADGRHAFYVTTEVTQVLGSSPITRVVEAPDLFLERMVFERAVHIPPRDLDVVRRRPPFGPVDPSPMARFVSEDATIHRALAQTGVVRLDGIDIGPAGAVRNGLGY